LPAPERASGLPGLPGLPELPSMAESSVAENSVAESPRPPSMAKNSILTFHDGDREWTGS